MTRTPKGWTIRATLLVISTVPPLVMLLVVAATLYFARVNEIRADIDERGRLAAAAVAEASEYGVVSGNLASLEETLRRLLSSDKSIAAIDILDLERGRLAGVRAGSTSSPDAPLVFEQPVQSQDIVVDLYDSLAEPHVSVPASGSVTTREGRTLAYVRVTMSPAPLLEAKVRSLLLTGVLLVVAGLLGLGIGLLLVERLRRPISQILTTLRDFGRGHYEAASTPAAPGELGRLQQMLVQVGRTMSATTKDLEDQVRDRTAALELANQQRRELLARSHAQLEDERRRIAGDIHDDMNAVLVALRLGLAGLAREAAKACADPETAARLDRRGVELVRMTDEMYAAARRITKQLRPEVLETLGIAGALAEMVDLYDSLHPGCAFTLHMDEALPQLDDQASITVYRLVQEALSNIVKHAHATSASVWVASEQEPPGVRIVVSDDGVGFDPGATPRGRLGLIGMRERVQSIGGSMEVRSSPGQGARLTFRLTTPG